MSDSFDDRYRPRFRVENLLFVGRPGIATVTSDALMKMNAAEMILSRPRCMPHSAAEWANRLSAFVVRKLIPRDLWHRKTRSSAVAEGPRDASCQLKSCQLPRNSAETTCTTSPEQIEVMKLEGYEFRGDLWRQKTRVLDYRVVLFV